MDIGKDALASFSEKDVERAVCKIENNIGHYLNEMLLIATVPFFKQNCPPYIRFSQ